jgi:hypothetical protein
MSRVGTGNRCGETMEARPDRNPLASMPASKPMFVADVPVIKHSDSDLHIPTTNILG